MGWLAERVATPARFATAVHMPPFAAPTQERDAKGERIAVSMVTNPLVVLPRLCAVLLRAGLLQTMRRPGRAAHARSPAAVTLADVRAAVRPARPPLARMRGPSPEVSLSGAILGPLAPALRDAEWAMPGGPARSTASDELAAAASVPDAADVEFTLEDRGRPGVAFQWSAGRSGDAVPPGA